MHSDLFKILADNPALITALREMFAKHLSIDTIDTSTPNEMIGQIVRARVEGLAAVNAVITEIERYRTPVARTVAENPAR